MPLKTIEEILKETKIQQILRPKCVSAPPDIALKEAIQIMQNQQSGYLMVTDKDWHVLGLFTERDVLMKVLGKGVSLDEPLKKYMKTDLIVLLKSDSVGAAVKAMKEYNVRHVPLVDEQGRMTGVLSVRTIVNFISELFPTEVFNLPPKSDQVFDTMEGG
ncbi:MAG: CBS domain-containing protein [Candidatus Omnitrophica bacterium]|nr:CBS domain-containing protein [Candidatus Omnitrophota bacterium]